MIPRVESFEIHHNHLRKLWIEDFKDGKRNHSILIDAYREGKCNRFRLWAGGISIGTVATIKEARAGLHAFAVQTLEEKQENLKENLSEVEHALRELGVGSLNLLKFANNPKETTHE